MALDPQKSESRDGRWLYYVAGDFQDPPSPIRRMPAGGEAELVSPEPVLWHQWAVTRSGIYLGSARRRGISEEYSIRFLDSRSGRVAEVYRSDGFGRLFHTWLAVSPDDASILVTASPAPASELMLVEGFR